MKSIIKHLTCGLMYSLITGGAIAQDKLRVGLLPISESLGAVMAEKLG